MAKKTSSIDSLFGGPPASAPQREETAPSARRAISSGSHLEMVAHDLIDAHPAHPCKLYGGKKGSDLLESIKAYGVLEPVTLWPKGDGRYTLLAGYNRLRNNELAGNKEIPAIVRQGLTDTTATLIMLHSNRQRGLEQMLVSERARMMALEYETLKALRKEQRQAGAEATEIEIEGKVLKFQHLEKTREAVAEFYGIKATELQYYTRLLELNAGLLEQVDKGELPVYVAALLSHLPMDWQGRVLDEMVYNGQKINKEIACSLKREYENGTLNEKYFNVLLHRVVDLTKQRPGIKVSTKILDKYFLNKTSKEVMSVIEKALELYFQSPAQNRK